MCNYPKNKLTKFILVEKFFTFCNKKILKIFQNNLNIFVNKLRIMVQLQCKNKIEIQFGNIYHFL